MKPTFQDQHFLGAEAVYARIEQGQGRAPIDVEAELLQVHADASTRAEDDER